jgi:hypothetical protein
MRWLDAIRSTRIPGEHEGGYLMQKIEKADPGRSTSSKKPETHNHYTAFRTIAQIEAALNVVIVANVAFIVYMLIQIGGAL